MKKFALILVMFITGLVSAQTSNQFDAEGKRHGIWKLQYHFWVIYIKKWFGANAQELHNYYKKYINYKVYNLCKI